MESSSDKQWASKYLLDPLNAPEPSQETGPGAHFGSTITSPVTPSSDSKKTATTHAESVPESSSYPTPPQSASPRSAQFNSHRHQAFGGFDDALPRRANSQRESSGMNVTVSPPEGSGQAGRRRGSSLNERFPGDHSHRPLDIIKRDSLRANRSRHLRKAQHSGSDSIDRLDDSVLGPYHHEGPYDAASIAKNRDPKAAPLAAVSGSNAEALKATPREKVVDSIRQHRPLDGTAFVPPGFLGPDGNVLSYEEGTDMMRFDGNELSRWEGIKYLPEDLKGKGEPSYSVEKALKDPKKGDHRRVLSDGSAIEMTNRSQRASSDVAGSGREARYSQWESDLRRTSSGNKGRDIVKHLGSLRHRHAHRAEEEPLTAQVKTRRG